MQAFKARYAGRCKKCDAQINIGQLVTWTRSAEVNKKGYVHLECWQVVNPTFDPPYVPPIPYIEPLPVIPAVAPPLPVKANGSTDGAIDSEYQKTVGEIADALVYYADVYSNPGSGDKQRMDEVARILREKGSLLRVRAYAIPKYAWFVKRGWFPQWDIILKTSAALIGLSNNVHQGDAKANDLRREEIIQALRLPSLRCPQGSDT